MNFINFILSEKQLDEYKIYKKLPKRVLESNFEEGLDLVNIHIGAVVGIANFLVGRDNR